MSQNLKFLSELMLEIADLGIYVFIETHVLLLRGKKSRLLCLETQNLMKSNSRQSGPHCVTLGKMAK